MSNPLVLSESLNCTVPKHMKKQRNLSLGIIFGITIGTAIGVATGNVGLWLSLGIAIGVAVGTTLMQQSKKDKEDKSE